jgi:hypothetical protein
VSELFDQTSRLDRSKRVLIHAEHELDQPFTHFRGQRVFCVPRRTSTDHVGCGHSISLAPLKHARFTSRRSHGRFELSRREAAALETQECLVSRFEYQDHAATRIRI